MCVNAHSMVYTRWFSGVMGFLDYCQSKLTDHVDYFPESIVRCVAVLARHTKILVELFNFL